MTREEALALGIDPPADDRPLLQRIASATNAPDATIGALLGISPSYVAHMRAGRRPWRPHKAQKFALASHIRQQIADLESLSKEIDDA